eukprot:3806126-Rhodomonas_salina.1
MSFAPGAPHTPHQYAEGRARAKQTAELTDPKLVISLEPVVVEDDPAQSKVFTSDDRREVPGGREVVGIFKERVWDHRCCPVQARLLRDVPSHLVITEQLPALARNLVQDAVTDCRLHTRGSLLDATHVVHVRHGEPHGTLAREHPLVLCGHRGASLRARRAVAKSGPIEVVGARACANLKVVSGL